MNDKDVRLSKFCIKNAERTFKWVNDSDIRRDFLINKEITWDNHLEHCKALQTDISQFYFAIYYMGEHVGNTGVKNIDEYMSKAEAWIYIGEKGYKGKGLGTTAFGKLLEFAKTKLNIKTIVVHVADFNQVAIRMYKKMGFIEMDVPSDEWKNKDVNIIAMQMDLQD